MNIKLDIEVERLSGKFVSKDDLADQLCEEIEMLGEISVDDSDYEITDVQVIV